MAAADDLDWTQVEPLLLRAETLLQAAAESLEQQQQSRRREREAIVRGLNDLRRPLLQIRHDLIALVESMAAEAAPGASPVGQARLQEQLPPLEGALLQLERLLVQGMDPPEPAPGEGIGPRLELLQLQELLEQRHQEVIDLKAKVLRLEAIVNAAGLAPDTVQESGSM